MSPLDAGASDSLQQCAWSDVESACYSPAKTHEHSYRIQRIFFMKLMVALVIRHNCSNFLKPIARQLVCVTSFVILKHHINRPIDLLCTSGDLASILGGSHLHFFITLFPVLYQFYLTLRSRVNTRNFLFGRSRFQISVRKQTILSFSWFSSVPSCKCRDSALN